MTENEECYSLRYDYEVTLITSSETIPGHIHSFGDWEITVPATDTTTGLKTRSCSCGKTETEIIPVTHTQNETQNETETEIIPATSIQTVVTKAAVTERITISRKPTIQKPAATKNKITVKWKHFKQTKKTKPIWKKIKKVQVQCATDKTFKNIVKTTPVKKSKTSAKIKGLKKNTTYYVRVRYFDGTGYSAWSKVKKVKTKK